MSPRDIACSHQFADLTNCGAGAGEPCHWPSDRKHPEFHSERLEVAGSIAGVDSILVPNRVIDDAVDALGLA